ncbi:MAG: hypothetical protein NW218_14005 [Saprospiraceae bacterium]|nr:hypothetical protein [Saprospiraceae bacterium]
MRQLHLQLLLCFLIGTTATSFAQSTSFPLTPVTSEIQSGFPQHIKEIVRSGSNLFAVLTDYEHQNSQSRLYKSSDNGVNWAPIPFFDDQDVLNVRANGDTIWVFRADYLTSFIRITGYRSVNAGQNFTQVLTFTESLSNGGGYFYPDLLEEAGNVLFFSVRFDKSGVKRYRRYHSIDRGATWLPSSGTYQNGSCRTLYAQGNYYRFQTGTSFVLCAPTPDMANPTVVNLGSMQDLLEAYLKNDTLFAVSKTGKVFYKKAPFNTGSYQQASPLPFEPRCVLASNGYWHYFTQYGGFYRAPLSNPSAAVATGFYPYKYDFSIYAYYPLRGFGILDNQLYLFGKIPLVSNDQGLTWDFPTGNFPRMLGSLSRINQELWMRQGFMGRYRNGAWQAYHTEGLLTSVTYNWNRVVEVQGAQYVLSNQTHPSKLYRSDDGGDHWTFVRNFDGFCYLSTDVDQKRLLVVAYVNVNPKGVWYSDDSGGSWAMIPGAPGAKAVLVKGDTIVAVQDGKVFASTNLGQQWQTSTLTYPVTTNFDEDNLKLFWQDNRLLFAAGSENRGNAYLSFDLGQSFLPVFQYDHIYQWNDLLFFVDQGVTHVSKNLGVSGVRLSNNDLFFRQSYVVADGFLYISMIEGTSNLILDEVERTDLTPIRDSLQNSEGGFVKGQVFLDYNQNCIEDAGDTPLFGQVLVFQPGNHIAVSNPDGSVYRTLPAGNYTLEVALPSFVATNICVDPAAISIEADSIRTFRAGITASLDPDLEVTLVGSAIRPGRPVYYTATVKNVGFVPTTSTVLSITFPDNILLYESANNTPVTIQAGKLQFSVPDLAPQTSITFKITFNVPPDPNLTGSLVLVEAILDAPYTDANNQNNAAKSIVTITNSYDPNDKTAITVAAPYDVMPVADKSLQYRIRFQNTGNDTAFTVVVVDTLSDRLDWSTFKMISASHPYRLQVQDPGIFIWKFDPILLPDSNRNEAASHGYILFSIKAKPNVIIGEVLHNMAAIYFDFNTPVLTNTTHTKVVRKVIFRDVEPLEDSVTAQAFQMVPNPAIDRIQLQFGMQRKNEGRVWLYDGLGRMVRTAVVPAGSERFDWALPDLAAGTYWLHWQEGDQACDQKLIILH